MLMRRSMMRFHSLMLMVLCCYCCHSLDSWLHCDRRMCGASVSMLSVRVSLSSHSRAHADWHYDPYLSSDAYSFGEEWRE